jgi:hypothetical protein
MFEEEESLDSDPQFRIEEICWIWNHTETNADPNRWFQRATQDVPSFF